MKRLLQLFLAGVFLISFTAHARVILPKGGEEWSVGSSVQLEWDASGESATIRLIRPDQDPIVIAENVADTGHYLWPIEELEAARTYRIEITPSGGDAVQSRTFRIIAWDTKQYLGEFDEDDRSRVTHPLEAAVLDKDKDNRTVMVDWVDYRHFLKNNVRIYLHQVGKLGQLDLKTKLDNTGSHDWKLNNRSIKACSEGSCYFVIRSGRKRNHLITSHSFTLGDVGQEGGIEITEEAAVGPSEDSAAPGSVLTLGWTGPEGKIRIDLYQAGYYHQTIKEEVFPVDDEGNYHLSWAIPAPLPGGEDYTVVLTSLADGTKQATSTPVSIEAAEGDVAVTRPKNISLGRKSTRLGWKNTQGPVDIDLYLDGRRVKTIARNTSPTRVHSWRLPGVLAGSDQYTVRVSQADDEGVFGISAPFSISAPERVGAKQPSQQSCEAAGLESGCTSSAIKVAKNAIKRECVKYRLYGEACTTENIQQEKAERQALLARVGTRPSTCGGNQEEINGVCHVLCGAGEIKIGNQCRPESQCPGLALLDDLPPEIIVPYEGPRRCDQNLLKAETAGDYRLASALKFLLQLMTMKNDIQLNWAMSVDLYDRFQRGIGAEAKCQSRQAQAYWGSALCESVANEQSVPERFKGTICARKDRPLCNAWGVNDPIPLDLNALSWPPREGFVSHAFNLGGPGSDRSVLDFLGKQAGYDYGGPRGMRDYLSEYLWDLARPAFDADNESAGPGLIKGFYWPDQPVVAPEAWDLLNPNAQVHAEFIWRTAKVREALFDPARVVVGDDYSGPPGNHPFVTTSGEAFVDCRLGYGHADSPTATMRSEAIGEEFLQCSDTPWEGFLALESNDYFFYRGLLAKNTPKDASVAQASVSEVVACNSGMGVSEAGVCEICPQGTSNENGLGPCQPCGINLYAQSGAPSCSLCPMSQVPQEGHGACMGNPCTEKEYWDITTRSCAKDARKRHKWVQMHFVGATDGRLLNHQRPQMHHANRVLERYASSARSPENDREIVWETGVYTLDGGSGFTRRPYPFLPDTLKEGELVERFGKTPEAYELATRLIHTSIKPQDRSVEWSEPAYTALGSDPATGARELLRRSARHHEAAQAVSGQREKAVFALHLNGHGNGFEAADVRMNDLRTIIRQELGDSRLDLVTFDSCKMANYESLLMLDGITKWVAGHTVNTPESGWAGAASLNLALASDDDKKARSTKAHIGRILENVSTKIPGLMTYDMKRFGPFRVAFDELLNHLADNISAHGRDLKRLYVQRWNHIGNFLQSCGQLDMDERVFGSEEPLEAFSIETHSHKYDALAFLQYFVSSNLHYEDDRVRKLAATALDELRIFVGPAAMERVMASQIEEDQWKAGNCLAGTGKISRARNADAGTMSSSLPFTWRMPGTFCRVDFGLKLDVPAEKCFASQLYSWEGSRFSSWERLPVDRWRRPLTGWEPLDALMRFDRAWLNYTKQDKIDMDCCTIKLSSMMNAALFGSDLRSNGRRVVDTDEMHYYDIYTRHSDPEDWETDGVIDMELIAPYLRKRN